MVEPEARLDAIVERLNEAAEPDAELCRSIGAGELENLLRSSGDQLWPRVEELARTDARFRRALRSVWAYESPEYERRHQLLSDLGEYWPEEVRFVGLRHGFGEAAVPGWRAIKRSGRFTDHELAEALRGVADWLDRREGA